jgi:hypothetical protein
LLCALLLVVPALAEDDPVEDPTPALPHGKLSRDKRDGPAVFVRLKEGGRLQLKDGEEWKDATLEKLGAFLDRAKRAHHAAMEKKAGSGYEIMPGGAKASKLFISIEADPETPWRHLLWLMTIAAEQKYYKLELSDGKRRMLVFLPIDGGIRRRLDPPPEIKVAVHVISRSEKEAKWGDQTVMRPTKILYRTGNRETASLDAVPRWITEAKRAADAEKNAVRTGEIRAGLKVPFAKILDVMECFVDHDWPAVSFFATPAPGPALRKKERLPFPLKNYPTAD